MIYTFSNPSKMGIYVNTQKKSLPAIATEVGSDFICNFQLFNGNWTACCFTKAGGKVIADDGYIYEGFGWNAGDGRLTWDLSRNHAKYENFAGCLTVVKDGRYPAYNIPAAISGRRGRTALGTKKDGTIVAFCVPDSQGMTIPELAQKLIELGCQYAINFDGGGSVQCRTSTGSITSPRLVHTLFYLIELPMEATVRVKVLRAGSKEKRLVQAAQQLLISGGYSCGWCGADGDFGTGTLNAVNMFKANHGLEKNGVIDGATWQLLLGGV